MFLNLMDKQLNNQLVQNITKYLSNYYRNDAPASRSNKAMKRFMV